MPSDEEQQKVEKLLIEARHPDASRNLLALLFPKLNAQLKVILPLTPEEEGGREARKSNFAAEFAQSYFGLTPYSLSWVDRNWKRFLTSRRWKQCGRQRSA